MSGLRIFSNGSDTTYNNYYNNRICNKKACPKPLKNKPPMTVVQASTSYRYDGELVPKRCDNKGGQMYPYGNYSDSRRFLDPPVSPPFDPLVDQAILEYGVGNIHCSGNSSCSDSDSEEEGVGTCLGKIDSVHCGTTHPTHVEHASVVGDKCCNPDFQMEMEQLKAYRFKCYECIDPCCPANMLALQMIRETRSTKSGTTTTTMSYGSTGTSTTTTTTVKF